MKLISLMQKNVLAIFLNGPISKKTFFSLKSSIKRLWSYFFISISIYQMYFNMRPIRYENIYFAFFNRISKKHFFQDFGF